MDMGTCQSAPRPELWSELRADSRFPIQPNYSNSAINIQDCKRYPLFLALFIILWGIINKQIIVLLYLYYWYNITYNYLTLIFNNKPDSEQQYKNSNKAHLVCLSAFLLHVDPLLWYIFVFGWFLVWITWFRNRLNILVMVDPWHAADGENESPNVNKGCKTECIDYFDIIYNQYCQWNFGIVCHHDILAWNWIRIMRHLCVYV